MKRATTVRQAIQQKKPFRSSRQEAVLALLLAAEAVRNRYAAILAQHDEITLQQYNVLRILRGAGADGLPTLDIVERMIEKTPGITRLIDRLEEKKLVERCRQDADRRQVWCRISQKGRDLLAGLDAPIDALDDKVLTCLHGREVADLIDALNRVRDHQHQGS